MRRSLPAVLLSLALFVASSSLSSVAAADSPLDYDVAGGHFYTQANGSPLGAASSGYSVTNDGGVAFWDAYQAYGGPSVLGYPVSGRFSYDGFVTQAMQKAVFQWRPDTGSVAFLNTFDALHDKGKDDWLLSFRQTPKPFDTSADTGLSWDGVVSRHLSFLDQNPAIRALFLSDPSWLDHYGLPVSYADEGNSFVIRAQRATFQYWKEEVPWARAGEVSNANGGDLAKEAGLWPAGAVVPGGPDGRSIVSGTNQYVAAIPAAPAPVPAPSAAAPGPIVWSNPALFHAQSPEYGVNTFLAGYAGSTGMDLFRAQQAGFGWVKTMLQWGQIEREGKGKFDWSDSDRVVGAVSRSGMRLIVRVDYTPDWARTDGNHAAPPYDFNNYRDFINALVHRYRAGSPFGHIDAIEVWNEPNLSREWGNLPPNPTEYTRLLKAAFEGSRMSDLSVLVISAGLSPTETSDGGAMPDDRFLQGMYDAGARQYFDVLGAHAPGFKAPPEMSPDQVAADPAYGGHRFFSFRRVEDLRDVMVRNADTGKQVWLTEFGWTSDSVHPAYSWHAVTEQQKADYLVRAFQFARANWSPWIGVMTVWNMPRPDWGPQHEEYWWSIVDPGGAPRPAYTAIQSARRSGALP